MTWLDQCQGSRTVKPSLLPRRKINTEGPPHQRQLNSVQVQMPKSVTKDLKIQNSIQSNCCNSEELRRMHASLLLHWVCRPPQAPGHAAVTEFWSTLKPVPSPLEVSRRHLWTQRKTAWALGTGESHSNYRWLILPDMQVIRISSLHAWDLDWERPSISGRLKGLTERQTSHGKKSSTV